MSIQVLIADDEFFIRQRLKKIIPWDNLGLTFAGEAQNGLEVICTLENQPIDIIILDIKMPKMDGIATAKYIRINHPDTQIIILSGYHDFEYARSAICYGVRNYLLKPTEDIQLISALQTCTHSIQTADQQNQKMRRYYHEELCSQLHHVLYGSSSKESLYSHYPFFKDMDQTLFLGIYDANTTDETVLHLARLLRELGYTCEYFKNSEYIYTLQMFLKNPLSLKPVEDVLNTFLKEEIPARFLSISPPIPMESDWLPDYKQVRQGLLMRYFEKPSSPFLICSSDNRQNYAPELSKIRHKITLCLNNRNEKELKREISELFEKIQNKKNTEYLHMVLLELFMSFHISHRLPGQTSADITNLVTTLLDEEYQLAELLHSAVSHGLQCIRNNTSQPSDVALSHKLMQYIGSHYTEQDLSISKIAGEFSLNPSYMGTAFKKANSISILQYLTTVRLEAALGLLKEDRYKITEIAEMVGYSDVFYFSKRFKTTYGYPPKDYAIHLS